MKMTVGGAVWSGYADGGTIEITVAAAGTADPDHPPADSAQRAVFSTYSGESAKRTAARFAATLEHLLNFTDLCDIDPPDPFYHEGGYEVSFQCDGDLPLLWLDDTPCNGNSDAKYVTNDKTHPTLVKGSSIWVDK